MYEASKPYKYSVLQAIQETWDTPYLSVQKGIYPVFTRKFSFPEIDHTDGIGTKGMYHWKAKTFQEAVQDALAMNLNDLALARATPFKLQNHLVVPGENKEVITQIVRYLVTACKERNIAITGGETSGGEISPKEQHPLLGITLTVSGFVPEQKENVFQEGDVLLGLKSSGLHANGLAKVRELFGEILREEFTIPTRIYDQDIHALSKVVSIHGMMHITGGAFTKLKDLLPGIDAVIARALDLKPQGIFYELYKKGVLDKEMYTIFNCGIGFVFSVASRDVIKIPVELQAFVIGKVVPGQGNVRIASWFSNETVVL